MIFLHNSFRKRLREARINAGKSVPRVALRMDVSTQKVFGWESTGELPTLDEFASLCDYYNADPAWILFGNKTADAEKG
jgi:transcriptional regulator with XRE-family HTH domain